MSSGLKATAIPPDISANPLGWRIANALAIASPYLLAAVLFVVLYLQPTTPPTHTAALMPPAAPESDLVTPRQEPAAAGAAPAAPSQAAAPSQPAGTGSGGGSGVPSGAGSPPHPVQPVAVDPVIASTMKLSGDRPAYPLSASMAHIQGTVVLSATIGANGAVRSLQPVSGPALLEAAALNAARSWRYRPWLIEGKAVPFTTQVIVEFKLDEPSQ